SIGIERVTGLARLDTTALASTAAAVRAVAYLVCATLAIIAPDLLLALFQSWVHGISVAPWRPPTPGIGVGAFAIGLVTFSGFVWLTTAATAWLYNRWAR